MSDRLEVDFCGVKFNNPVVAASGTFGFGREYSEYFNISSIGGIASKGLTLNPCEGNPGIRIWETSSGILNSIGLENPGVEAFINKELPFMQKSGTKVIVNLGGHSKEEYIKGIKLLNNADIDILELNISCPNVKKGGMAFGLHPESAYEITSEVKKICKFPLVVKLSPNAYDIVEVAKAVEKAGADGISMVNTFLGMAIDINNRKKVFENTYAGFSGPAIKPIALRMVHQVAKTVDIPIMAIGGIADYKDALEFIMAGASIIQVGSATFNNMYAIPEIINGLECYCEEENIKNILDIKGII